jgi:hypothetical protein
MAVNGLKVWSPDFGRFAKIAVSEDQKLLEREFPMVK